LVIRKPFRLVRLNMLGIRKLFWLVSSDSLALSEQIDGVKIYISFLICFQTIVFVLRDGEDSISWYSPAGSTVQNSSRKPTKGKWQEPGAQDFFKTQMFINAQMLYTNLIQYDLIRDVCHISNITLYTMHCTKIQLHFKQI
jgi:hypothetical protein